MRKEAQQERQRHNERGKDATTIQSNGRGDAMREATRWDRWHNKRGDECN